MKRQTKTITAFILALLLIMAAPASVFAGSQEGDLSGTSEVEDVVMNVLVPANLNFALDPLGLDATGANQISTQDFFFLNQSFAPVKVDVAITASTSGGAVLVSTDSAIKKDDVTVTDKKIYFGALGGTGVTGGAIATGTTYSAIFGSTTGPAIEYSTVSSAAGTLSAFAPSASGTTGAALISFALDEAIESTVTAGAIQSLAADNNGVAGFQFYAAMNTYADWAANDVTVSGTYTLTALRDSTYDAFTFVSGSLNQLVVAVAAPEEEEEEPVVVLAPGFITSPGVTATTRTSVNHTKASTADWPIDFHFGDATITSITGTNGATPYTIPTAEYTRDAVNDDLIFKGGTSSYYIRSIGTGNQTITITLSTGAVCTFTMVQQ